MGELISKDEKYPIQRPLLIPAQAPNSEIPVHTVAASPQKQKRRRLVAAYDYDDLEPAHAVNSEPIPTTDSEPVQASTQKPARFKRRAHKPARASTIYHTTRTFSSSDAPENYKSDVVDESDKVALEALQSLAKAGEEPSKSQSQTQEQSAQDTVEKVADPPSDNDEDDESSDDDNDDNDNEVPQSHLQQKWESTSQYHDRLQTLNTNSEPLPRDLQIYINPNQTRSKDMGPALSETR
ncbi:mating-type protein A-alpha Z3-like [Daucus carota subsp. sativus]|uniref:mating-type protein A-alpha Z3-like n=1 Tax=Daucus carota subsp. sativus TaxID=79200 RepID=UPI0030828C84